ncbi:class I SAM-dependent methyltransferase [Streptomyces sp. HUAS MG47]|uniref:class I SAM-dependent methyltransferase n=1 Tax=Streptomyces solicamelliae TaxID=3231716 RepID=UPI00387823D1
MTDSLPEPAPQVATEPMPGPVTEPATKSAAEPAFVTATRASYDAIATAYAERYAGVHEAEPLGPAILDAFAALVHAAGGGPVVEVGSGPGEVTAMLHARGLDVHGVDLSPVMVAMARRDHPQVRFEEGSMTALDLGDESLGGLVAWYSLIHIAPEAVPDVLAGFHRVLAPGGLLLLAFQVGDEPQRYTEGFGHSIDLDFHRLRPERLERQLGEAGFTVQARMEREANGTEPTPQAYVLARKGR